jgi:hypothetical protein
LIVATFPLAVALRPGHEDQLRSTVLPFCVSADVMLTVVGGPPFSSTERLPL